MIFENFRTNCLVCDRIEKFIGEINGERMERNAPRWKRPRRKRKKEMGYFENFTGAVKLMIKT